MLSSKYICLLIFLITFQPLLLTAKMSLRIFSIILLVATYTDSVVDARVRKTRERIIRTPQADYPQTPQPSFEDYYDEYDDEDENKGNNETHSNTNPESTSAYPQPPDEIPTEEGTTIIFQQPDDEIPTVGPRGNIDISVIPPTRIPTESHAVAYSCSENGKFYQEGQYWKKGRCTNCTCSNGNISCKILSTCRESRYLTCIS